MLFVGRVRTLSNKFKTPADCIALKTNGDLTFPRNKFGKFIFNCNSIQFRNVYKMFSFEWWCKNLLKRRQREISPSFVRNLYL